MTTRMTRATNSRCHGDQAEVVREAILRWSAEAGRHGLPWRQTREPYAILVSEVMLQQTQVSRVEPRWRRWLERWPTVADLAGASQADVIREWSGLGYNMRAMRLWRTANIIATDHHGVVPTEPSTLRTLPGIGRYTADAVACFSGSAKVVPVDVNVGRVLARVIHGRARGADVRPENLRKSAEDVAGPASHRDIGLALMDLGATVCTARGPRCDACPVRVLCAWRAAGFPQSAVTTTPAQPFEETARFARGRIVAALGRKPQTVAELLTLLPEQHADRLDSYLSALAADGLIERGGEIVRLAGDSG